MEKTGAKSIPESVALQTLWGGYGELLRVSLEGAEFGSVILKWVVLPASKAETLSYRRKKRSYEVEQAWYNGAARACDDLCRVARCLGIEHFQKTSFLLLEDLNTAGYFPDHSPSINRFHSGLNWLAHFHARFLGTQRSELWPCGTYWHLDTRPQEWEKMPEGPLKDSARALDLRLKGAEFQTLVHGDAKPPNFCWNAQDQAAAVDFQYVGHGCGIRDVALFIGRALGSAEPDARAEELLNVYFKTLRQALGQHAHNIDLDALEREWRELYPVAWSDYARFGLGWGRSPVLSPYSKRQIERALSLI